MNRHPLRLTLAAGLAAVAVTACSSSDDGDGKSSTGPATTLTTSSSAAPTGFVAKLNSLCEALIPKVLAINDGQIPTLERFPTEQPKLAALFKDFDREVDALPVTAADQPAIDAFNAFRRDGVKADAQLLAAAKTGDEATFDAAVAATRNALEESGILQRMSAAGIECPAR